MTFQQLFLSANGRIGRRQYWVGAAVILAVIGLPWLLTFVPGASQGAAWVRPVSGLLTLLGLAMLYPGVCLYTKRLHDLGLSGWFQVILYAVSVAFSVYVLAVVMPPVMTAVTQHAGDAAGQQTAIKAMTDTMRRPGGLVDVGHILTLVKILLIAALGTLPSQPTDSRYGPAPEADGRAAVFE